MERELGNLDREFRIAEQSYGTDHLDLVLANGYLGKLLGNAQSGALSGAAPEGNSTRISEAR